MYRGTGDEWKHCWETGRLRVSKQVRWYFTLSQPVQLYQGEAALGLRSTFHHSHISTIHDIYLWETRDHDITSCNWLCNVGFKLALFSSDSDTRRWQPMKMSYGIINWNVWGQNLLGHGAWGSLNWLTRCCPEPPFLHYTAITVKCFNSDRPFCSLWRLKKKKIKKRALMLTDSFTANLTGLATCQTCQHLHEGFLIWRDDFTGFRNDIQYPSYWHNHTLCSW